MKLFLRMFVRSVFLICSLLLNGFLVELFKIFCFVPLDPCVAWYLMHNAFSFSIFFNLLLIVFLFFLAYMLLLLYSDSFDDVMNL